MLADPPNDRGVEEMSTSTLRGLQFASFIVQYYGLVLDLLTLGKKFAEGLVSKLSVLVELYLTGELDSESSQQAHVSMIIALRSLVKLLLGKEDVVLNNPSIPESETKVNATDLDVPSMGPKNKYRTDPRFVCDVNGVAAVRRRCSHGIHKDRRFYLCGMERKNRCKYFKWADDDDNKHSVPTLASVPDYANCSVGDGLGVSKGSQLSTTVVWLPVLGRVFSKQ